VLNPDMGYDFAITQMRDYMRKARHRENEERVSCFGGYQ